MRIAGFLLWALMCVFALATPTIAAERQQGTPEPSTAAPLLSAAPLKIDVSKVLQHANDPPIRIMFRGGASIHVRKRSAAWTDGDQTAKSGDSLKNGILIGGLVGAVYGLSRFR